MEGEKRLESRVLWSTLALLGALLLAVITPLAPAAQGPVGVASLSIESRNATHVIMSLSIDRVRVGTIALVFSDTIDFCYHIRLEYSLLRDQLRSVAGFDPSEVQLLARWMLAPDPMPPWWYENIQGSGSARGLSGFIILSTVTPPISITSMVIYELKASLIVSDGYVGGYVWILDISSLLDSQGITLRYAPNLGGVRVSHVEKEAGANWVIYKLVTGRRVTGTITVTGYPSFRDARVVVVRFTEDPLDRGLERFLTVYIEGLLDGEHVSRVFRLKRGEALAIPEDLPGDLRGRSSLVVYSLRIEVVWSVFTLYTINVTEDTGVIVVDLAKIAELLEGPARLLKIEDLGRGWLAAYIGINATLNGVDTRVSIAPAPGSVEPEYVKTVVIRDHMGHKLVFKVIMFFSRPGFFEGEIAVERPDSERPGVVYKTVIPRVEVSGGPPVDRVAAPLHIFYMPLSGFLESEIKEIERKMARGAGTFDDIVKLGVLRTELANAREDQWVVVLDVNMRLRWEQWLEVFGRLVLVPSDTSKPITLRAVVETERRGLDISQNRFSYLVFGDWSGYSRLAPHPRGSVLELKLTVGYVLEELLDGSISRDNVIKRVLIFIDNAERVAIGEDMVVLCTAPSPARDPRVSTADLAIPETPARPEREALEILLAVILSLLLLAIASMLLPLAPKLALSAATLASSLPTGFARRIHDRLRLRSSRAGGKNFKYN